MPNGDIRESDVSVYTDKNTGKPFIKSEEGRGTSIVDKEGIFGYGKWEYVTIPQGTIIPKELIITKDHYMARKQCWHYSISPNFDMPVDLFLATLDQFAMNANAPIKAIKHA